MPENLFDLTAEELVEWLISLAEGAFEQVWMFDAHLRSALMVAALERPHSDG